MSVLVAGAFYEPDDEDRQKLMNQLRRQLKEAESTLNQLTNDSQPEEDPYELLTKRVELLLLRSELALNRTKIGDASTALRFDSESDNERIEACLIELGRLKVVSKEKMKELQKFHCGDSDENSVPRDEFNTLAAKFELLSNTVQTVEADLGVQASQILACEEARIEQIRSELKVPITAPKTTTATISPASSVQDAWAIFSSIATIVAAVCISIFVYFYVLGMVIESKTASDFIELHSQINRVDMHLEQLDKAMRGF